MRSLLSCANPSRPMRYTNDDRQPRPRPHVPIRAGDRGVRRGGEMTRLVPGWWTNIVCYIGQSRDGSFYCANECREGKCHEPVTAKAMDAFRQFGEQHAAEFRKDRARAAQRQRDRAAGIRSYETRGSG